MEPAYISESWASASRSLLPVIYGVQYQAATLGSNYVGDALAEQGLWVAPEGWVDPTAFVGSSATGGPVGDLLNVPVIRAKQSISAGTSVEEAVRQAGNLLGNILVGLVADVARQSTSVDIAAREGVGYIRVASGSTCARCAILLGKFFRWNAGFQRHPGDDCIHLPTTRKLAPGIMGDPYEMFKGLSPAEQDKVFTKAGAQAIRDGADIYQVVNAHQKMTKSGMFTLSGTSKRGNAGKLLGRGQRRMTPDAIYKTARTREEALAALRQQGYILPGGQVPGGSLRGRVEGYGQLGGGGRRKAAVASIEQARATGVRDPRNRYTMTAAERRVYDAEQRYRMVLEGRNPYASPGFGSTPDLYGRRLNTRGAGPVAPLTPQIAAQVEKDYRRWLASGGQIYQ